MIEFGKVIDQEFPPTDGWPAPVAALADELTTLYERKVAADSRLLDLVGNDTTSTRADIAAKLEKEDAAALVAATRAGTSTAKIGKPATEKYEKALADARRGVLAVDAAIAACTIDLQAAMTAHRAELLAANGDMALDGHVGFVAAVAALDAARTKLYRSAAVEDFIERVTASNPQGRVIYDPNAPREIRGAFGIHVPGWPQMLSYLNAEAEAMRPTATDDTEVVLDDPTTTTTTTTTTTADAA